MEHRRFNPQEEQKIKKAKCINYIGFGIVVIGFCLVVGLVAVLLVRYGSYRYWHTFTSEKWLENPERRAKMTADLFEDYMLIGMTEDEVIDLLGQNNNDYGYFNQNNRFVYYLGNERTIIDSEWLLIDFENDIVKEYSMTMD